MRRNADVGVYAVVVAHQAVRVVGHRRGVDQKILRVLAYVRVDLRYLLCCPSGTGAVAHARLNTVLQEHRAVNLVARQVAQRLHRILYVVGVFFQGLLRILRDDVHHLHRASVVFGLDDGEANQKHAEYGCKYFRDGDGCYFKAY